MSPNLAVMATQAGRTNENFKASQQSFPNLDPPFLSPSQHSPSNSAPGSAAELVPELQELPPDILSLLRSLPFFHRARLAAQFSSTTSLNLSATPTSQPPLYMSPAQLSPSANSATLLATGVVGSDDFLSDVAKVMHLRHCNAGDVVIKEGDAAKAMFFVVKGTVKVISEDGEINYAELGPGNFCKCSRCAPS